MTLQHLHTYVLYKDRSGKAFNDRWYRCGHPECTHFAPIEMVLNKKATCSNCGCEYILTREAARRVYPRCLDCGNTKEGKLAKTAAAAMDKLFKVGVYSDFLLPDPPAALEQQIDDSIREEDQESWNDRD